VNLDDLRDVRAQLTGDDSQIEVRLGREDLTKRLRQSLEALDEQRSTPRGQFITYIDMTQGKRAVIGFKAHALNQDAAATASVKSDGSATNDDIADVPEKKTTPNVAADTNRRAAEVKKTTVQSGNKSRPSVERAAKVKADKKQPVARDGGERTATGQTRGGVERPRRVGRSG
jgi:trehalose/maltose hydrolase-like predicted phosphorylase